METWNLSKQDQGKFSDINLLIQSYWCRISLLLVIQGNITSELLIFVIVEPKNVKSIVQL